MPRRPEDLDTLSSLAERGRRALESCRLCPWDCRVDRSRAELGVCGLGAEARAYKAFIHRGEERALIPSYTVDLTGCNLRCRFCSERAIVAAPAQGRLLREWPSREQLTAARARGARNLHVVGGEPIVNLPGLLAFLASHAEACRGWPLVVNTNLYASSAARRMLLEVADVIVADLKWGNEACALRLSAAPRYLPVVLENLGWLVAGGASLLLRHLLVPGHLDCCTRALLRELSAWPGLPLNLMTAYVPFGASDPGASISEDSPEAHMPSVSERRALVERVLALPEASVLNRLVDGEPARRS